jgi:hypothetical protein
MGPGGCDKTQEMIEDWERRTKGLLEDTTPSQLQGLDPSQDVGIVGGPLGEDDPKAKRLKKALKKEEYGAGFEGTKKLVHNYIKDTPGAVRTIKSVVRAKYKRRVL